MSGSVARTLDDLFSRCDKSGGVDACWPWTASIGKRGYGVIEHLGKTCTAHRLVMTLMAGRTLGEKEFACHHCDNRTCINPKHLYLGTSKQNQEDAVKRGRTKARKITHCPKGHEYTAENTDIRTTNGGYMSRSCLICRKEHGRLRRINNKDAVREYMAEWYKKNKAKHNAACREYWRKHKAGKAMA